MSEQYVFAATPPVENPAVEERFREYLTSGRPSDWAAYLEAQKACRHEQIAGCACGEWHEQLVMGLI